MNDLSDAPLSDEVFLTLNKRLDGVCKIVFESTKITDENRAVVEGLASTYSMTLNAIVRAAGGFLPKASKPIVDVVNEFIVFVEEMYSENNQPAVKSGGRINS